MLQQTVRRSRSALLFWSVCQYQCLQGLFLLLLHPKQTNFEVQKAGMQKVTEQPAYEHFTYLPFQTSHIFAEYKSKKQNRTEHTDERMSQQHVDAMTSTMHMCQVHHSILVVSSSLFLQV